MEFQFHLWPHTRYASFDEIANVVQAAERFGYTAAANGEHIIVPNGPEADLVGPSYFDPMVIFSYLAARTTRIRLQYCAMVVPYRHPALSARGLASIDHASGGRLEVVIGSGWASSEFAALEVPYKSRGPITDEYMDAMRRLWTEDAPSIDGEFVSFGPTTFEPKCVQKPHVPLWIGGTGAAPLRRMAAYGSGWAPMVGSFDEVRDGIVQTRHAVAAAGRSPEGLGFSYGLAYLQTDAMSDASSEVMHDTSPKVIAGSSAEALDILGTYSKAGITRVNLECRWLNANELIEKLQQFSEEVISQTADT